MRKLILIAILIFGFCTVLLAEGGETLFNPSSDLKMPVAYSSNTDSTLKPPKLQLQADSAATASVTPDSGKEDNRPSITSELFSAAKKAFFGIISALGIDIDES